jgi:hypothetical protein
MSEWLVQAGSEWLRVARVGYKEPPLRLAFCTFRRAEEISSWTTCVLVDFGF